jgi:hypothetical protein
MIKKIISTGRSTNSNALDIKFHNSQNEFPIKIIDSSDVSSPKRVLLYIRDNSAGFDETVLLWKEFYFGPKNTHPKTFDFYGEYTASGYVGSNYIFDTTVVVGKKYRLNESNTGFELMGNSSPGTEIQIFNNNVQSLNLIMKKSNSILSTATVASGATKGFAFKKTIYIGATTDLVNPYEFSNINTEISFLGVAAAHVVMTEGSEQPYQFSLSNIVYS